MMEPTSTSTRTMLKAMPVSGLRQKGVVLIITLIVLVAMMLGALTMIRATDSATLVAGNLAFKQSALASGDSGVEAAAAWLAGQTSATLWNDGAGNGYFAKVESPNALSGQTWSAFWDSKPASDKCAVAWNAGVATCSNNPTEDSGGNKVAYMIHRLCRYKAGDVVGGKALTGNSTDPAADCATAAGVADAGGASHRSGQPAVPISTTDAYYRITVRSTGPRNTVTFTQVVVAR